MFLNKIKSNTKVKILLKNNKILKGIFLGHDNFMNIILDSFEEYQNNLKIWEYRKLGFCLIRGDVIICISKENY